MDIGCVLRYGLIDRRIRSQGRAICASADEAPDVKGKDKLDGRFFRFVGVSIAALRTQSVRMRALRHGDRVPELEIPHAICHAHLSITRSVEPESVQVHVLRHR